MQSCRVLVDNLLNGKKASKSPLFDSSLFHYLMLLYGVEGCGGERHLLCNAFFQPSLLKPIGLLSIYETDKSSIKII